MSCGIGHRHGSDLALLWLWHRPTATAPIRPLAWEASYAAGAALERPKKSFIASQDGKVLRVFLLASTCQMLPQERARVK